jgi:hypothetical protein
LSLRKYFSDMSRASFRVDTELLVRRFPSSIKANRLCRTTQAISIRLPFGMAARTSALCAAFCGMSLEWRNPEMGGNDIFKGFSLAQPWSISLCQFSYTNLIRIKADLSNGDKFKWISELLSPPLWPAASCLCHSLPHSRSGMCCS